MATSTTTLEGRFIIKCNPSHYAQVDPIVAFGPGAQSGHLHEFFGKRSTTSDSTLSSMLGAGTTCGFSRDTAGYWSPALFGPNGQPVSASGISAYYKCDASDCSTTEPYPPDLRLIAGGTGSLEYAFWSCKSEGVKYSAPPVCDSSTFPRMIVRFPHCWNGQLDSSDHRSHVVYPRGSACPSSHPRKLPSLKLYIRFPQSIGGPGYVFSDGTTLAHADFWNTWNQAALTDLVNRCLNVGKMCSTITG